MDHNVFVERVSPIAAGTQAIERRNTQCGAEIAVAGPAALPLRKLQANLIGDRVYELGDSQANEETPSADTIAHQDNKIQSDQAELP